MASLGAILGGGACSKEHVTSSRKLKKSTTAEFPTQARTENGMVRTEGVREKQTRKEERGVREINTTSNPHGFQAQDIFYPIVAPHRKSSCPRLACHPDSTSKIAGSPASTGKLSKRTTPIRIFCLAFGRTNSAFEKYRTGICCNQNNRLHYWEHCKSKNVAPVSCWGVQNILDNQL